MQPFGAQTRYYQLRYLSVSGDWVGESTVTLPEGKVLMLETTRNLFSNHVLTNVYVFWKGRCYHFFPYADEGNNRLYLLGSKKSVQMKYATKEEVRPQHEQALTMLAGLIYKASRAF